MVPIITFDQIQVWFQKRQFHHCFYESTKRDNIKDRFSSIRAERIDWIKAALQDPHSERYVGWNKKRKQHDRTRRVAVVQSNYVVIIRMIGNNRANFVTAFVADTQNISGRESTIEKIRNSPKWP